MKPDNNHGWISVFALLCGLCGFCAAVWLNVFQRNTTVVYWEFEHRLTICFIVCSGVGAGLSFVKLYNRKELGIRLINLAQNAVFAFLWLFSVFLGNASRHPLIILLFPGLMTGFLALALMRRKTILQKLFRAEACVCMAVLFVTLSCLAGVLMPYPLQEVRGSAFNACIYNLRLMDSAKQEWGGEHHMTAEAVPTERDLTNNAHWNGKPYLEKLPRCPLGGTYTIGPLSDPATCSLPGHAMHP